MKVRGMVGSIEGVDASILEVVAMVGDGLRRMEEKG